MGKIWVSEGQRPPAWDQGRKIDAAGVIHLHPSLTPALTSKCMGRRQVSGFFEPSIQSTVDSIRENFTEILPVNSVRELGSTWSPHLMMHP